MHYVKFPTSGGRARRWRKFRFLRKLASSFRLLRKLDPHQRGERASGCAGAPERISSIPGRSPRARSTPPIRFHSHPRPRWPAVEPCGPGRSVQLPAQEHRNLLNLAVLIEHLDGLGRVRRLISNDRRHLETAIVALTGIDPRCGTWRRRLGGDQPHLLLGDPFGGTETRCDNRDPDSLVIRLVECSPNDHQGVVGRKFADRVADCLELVHAEVHTGRDVDEDSPAHRSD